MKLKLNFTLKLMFLTAAVMFTLELGIKVMPVKGFIFMGTL